MTVEEEFIRLRLAQLREQYYKDTRPLVDRLAGIYSHHRHTEVLFTQLPDGISMTEVPARTNAEVAVDPGYFWRPIGPDTPRGVKLQLLSRGGVATHGQWDGKSDFWTDWTPLPKRRPR